MNQYYSKLFFILTIHVVFGYNNNFNIQSKPSDEARITNGKIAKVGEVPSIVQLLADCRGEPYCAGTLITKKRVLTAAHCVYDFYAQR